jgi:ABC-type sulfate/molybdate transport systems ATPase subunit
VSHDAEQTSRLARRVLYMDAGRLEHRSSGA